MPAERNGRRRIVAAPATAVHAAERAFVERGERGLAAEPRRGQRQVVERRAVVVVEVVPVLAVLEQRPELDGLIRLVVVHRTRVEPGEAQGQAGGDRQRDEGAGQPAAHFGRP